jgi:hypothetical protein
MPPFITHNGQTGYFQNGVFMPMSKQQYDMQFGNNPFVAAQQPYTQQQAIPQGVIQPPMAGPLSNEQKISLKQGDATTTDVVNKPIAQNNQSVNNASVNNNPYIQPMQDFGSIMAGQMYKFNNPNFTAQSQVQKRINNISQPAPESELLQSATNAAQNVTTNSLQNTTSGVLANAATNAATSNATTVTDPILQNMGNGQAGFFQDQMQNANNAAANATQATSDGLDGLGFSGKWNFSPGKAFSNSKDFFGSEAGQATSAGIGAGLGIATSLIGANASKYDQRVGMSKPNAFSTIAGDSTVTQIGLNPALMAATGGLSAVAGLSIDAVKNTFKYLKQKDKYDNKKLAVDSMQQLDDARENMKPDYTGYARNGTQVNPYLKAQYGTKVIVDGKKINTDSRQYREMYNSGNLMRVDKDGIPIRWSEEDVVVTAPMTEEERNRRKWNGGAGTYQPPTASIQSTVPTGTFYTDPSVPYAKIRPEHVNFDQETEEGRKNEAVFRAKETMDAIKSTPEYKHTLWNAIEKSRGFLNEDEKRGFSDYMTIDGDNNWSTFANVDFPYLDKNKQSLYDYQFKNPYGLYYDLENQRNQVVDYNDVSILSKEEAERTGYDGYMMPKKLEDVYDKNRLPEYTFSKYIKMKDEPNMDEHVATAVEEIEHWQQFRPYRDLSGDIFTPYRSPYENNPGRMHNITPFEAEVVKKYNTSNDSYLRDPTETAAKKRAAEVFFIQNKMLKPGQKMGLEHHIYLRKEYNKWLYNEKTFVPGNVLQYYMLSLPSYKDDTKIWNEYMDDAQKEGIPLELNIEKILDEKNQTKAMQNFRKKQAHNFIMLSKLLAKNNKNPSTNEPIS